MTVLSGKNDECCEFTSSMPATNVFESVPITTFDEPYFPTKLTEESSSPSAFVNDSLNGRCLFQYIEDPVSSVKNFVPF